MYGLIVQIQATLGSRDRLIELLSSANDAMPGCESYVIAKDPDDADAIWITEVWDSAESHGASLALPQVRETIAEARPLIAGFGKRIETEPVGGTGLS